MASLQGFNQAGQDLCKTKSEAYLRNSNGNDHAITESMCWLDKYGSVVGSSHVWRFSVLQGQGSCVYEGIWGQIRIVFEIQSSSCLYLTVAEVVEHVCICSLYLMYFIQIQVKYFVLHCKLTNYDSCRLHR